MILLFWLKTLIQKHIMMYAWLQEVGVEDKVSVKPIYLLIEYYSLSLGKCFISGSVGILSILLVN